MTNSRKIEIVPSLLAADHSRLADDLRRALAAGVGWVSVDVMDGHFVPNLCFGPETVRAIKRAAEVFVDVHLMVDHPAIVADWFVDAGADLVTVHLEACGNDARALLRRLRSRGVKAGLAIKPQTPPDRLVELLDDMDVALVMTVEPGFAGAEFIDGMLPKIAAVRRAIDERSSDCRLQVDGGINCATVSAAASAGADCLVAGNSIFGAADITGTVRALRRSAEKAFYSSRK